MGIFSTKDSIMVNKFVSYSLKERNYKNDEGERTVEVSEDVINQLHAAHYSLKRKEIIVYALSLKRAWNNQKEKKEII